MKASFSRWNWRVSQACDPPALQVTLNDLEAQGREVYSILMTTDEAGRMWFTVISRQAEDTRPFVPVIDPTDCDPFAVAS
jgi:hypothetical protein